MPPNKNSEFGLFKDLARDVTRVCVIGILRGKITVELGGIRNQSASKISSRNLNFTPTKKVGNQ